MYRQKLRVNEDTVRKIVCHVMKNVDSSRGEIAADCGVGVRTVSEVVDFFIDKSLFVKSLRSEKTVAGARPERVRLDPKYNCVIYSLFASGARASLIDADENIVASDSFACSGAPLEAGRFASFAAAFEQECEGKREAYRFGVGVVCSDDPLLGERSSRDAIEKSIFDVLESSGAPKRISIAFRRDLVGSFISRLPEYRDKNVICISVNRNEIHPTLVTGRGIPGVDRAEDALSDLRRRFAELENGDEIAKCFADVCSAIRKIFPVHAVILDSEEHIFIDGLKALMLEALRGNYDDGELRIICVPDNKPTIAERASMAELKEMFAADIVKTLFD